MTKKVGLYEMGRELGKGAFGLVKQATNSETGEEVAIKILDKEKIKQEDLGESIKKENIVKLKEVLASNSKIYLVLELIKGGDLFDHIKENRGLDEDTARGISHRDLKPENILINEEGVVKISDFGLSVFCKRLQQGPNLMHTTCGTLNYIAPEIVKNTGYDGQMADIWACGVILYFMMTGLRPFDDDSVHKLLDKIIVGDFRFPQDEQKVISDEAKDLVKCILNPNPRKRQIYTIENIKMHPWIQINEDLFSKNWSESDIFPGMNNIPDEMSSNQGGVAFSQGQSPSNNGMTMTNNNLIGMNNMPPSDQVSFSSMFQQNNMGQVNQVNLVNKRNQNGPQISNCFELLNFLHGQALSNIFEIKPKKKDPISLTSPFAKKKQPFKIHQNGSLLPFYFYTKEEPQEIFDQILEEITKFQDPIIIKQFLNSLTIFQRTQLFFNFLKIIIPDSQQQKITATYYKVKPTVGTQSARSKSPMKRSIGKSGSSSGFTTEEQANKIVEVVFQIVKISKSVSLGTFTIKYAITGSVEAFDEVLIAMSPVIKKYKIVANN